MVYVKGVGLILKKAGRAALTAVNKRRAKKQFKSLKKYNIRAAAASLKGPVPLKKQSPIKSTLSGRVYTSIKKGPGSNFRLDPTTGSAAAEFQSRVRDLIGIDQISVRAAHRATHIARVRRQNRLKKKKKK